MKSLKSIKPKRAAKQEREHQVLLGLVDYYIKTGKAVGSNTLKDEGFENLSSATIRNYFAALEEDGYLMQQHTSGGRIPTNQAFRLYAQEFIEQDSSSFKSNESIKSLRQSETREIASYLLNAAEILSNLTNTAIFLSAPRFDHDYVIDLKLVTIDTNRCLCVIVTDFGVIQTEILYIDKKLTSFSAKRVESYFHWRLTGNDKPENLTEDEEKLAQQFYNELMVRYIVGYSNFTNEEIHRTGFSKLLSYPDFHETATLAKSLALFENVQSMRLMLKECSKLNQIKCWIGEDLETFSQNIPECSVIAVPYSINQQSVGAIALLGPVRIPYSQLFQLLKAFSEAISEALTRNIYKYKISFRQPQQESLEIQKAEHRLLGHSHFMLLENKVES